MNGKLLILLTALAAFFPARPVDGAPTRVACVGDSITFGAGVEDRAKNNYPARLQAMLGDAYEVRNFGVSGATMLKKGNKPYWKLNEFQAARDFKPDIVIIKLGTNDSKPGNWKNHSGDYMSDTIEMIGTFRKLESRPEVWICLPVPVFAPRWGINEETVAGEIIPKIKEAAEATKAKIIDLHAPFEGKPELVPDKVHPNAAGAKLIAETVKAAITGK